MKLLRFGPEGAEKPGALDADGNLRDFSTVVSDWTPENLSPARLQAMAAIDMAQLPVIDAATRLGVPVAGARQFIAIGLNYRKHAEEAGMAIPEEPVVFMKAITSLCGPNDDTVLPEGAQEGDWEVELGFVIGTTARRVPVASALDHVAGYCLANDVSERHWQIKRNGQWGKGKSFDTFGPVGPWLVTRDELSNPHALAMELRVNDEVRQSSHTGDMIFSVAEIVAYLSQFMTLLPGDIVITGTPSGVGLGMKPPKFLQRGDVVTLSIEGLGSQRQQVR